jgi:hypothetical protein
MALSPTEREQIIQAILASGSGIFGTAVCQLCGQLGTYSGWAQAMSSHHEGEFVCWAHGHVEPEERGGVRSYGPVELAPSSAPPVGNSRG